MKRDKKRSLPKTQRERTKWYIAGCLAADTPNDWRLYREAQLGTFGAASEVRKVDPADYLKGKKP
jgi:hypothetical protein